MEKVPQTQQIIKGGIDYEAENKVEKYDNSNSNAVDRIFGIFHLSAGALWNTGRNYDHASAISY